MRNKNYAINVLRRRKNKLGGSRSDVRILKPETRKTDILLN